MEQEDQTMHKKLVIDAFKNRKSGKEISELMNEYFKKYCLADVVIETKQEPYDLLNAPLLVS